MNILVLYHSAQTFTNTVFEHLNAFSRFSRHRYFFAHHDQLSELNIDLGRFDGVVIHYCLRMPYDQVSESAAQRLAAYQGPKALFIQDEYDHTRRTWHWIRRLGLQLVFTVVPEEHIAKIYPPEEFPGVRFVSNLTGYVPEELQGGQSVAVPSQRQLVIGYRGRSLPVRYGQLGFEKVNIGKLVKGYCEERRIPHDIAWTEEARIYGAKWYEFMVSCRAMLGSESGSNVFDWNGDLESRITSYKLANPRAGDEEVYGAVVAAEEQPGVMNQVSPRVFECISARTAMVLFEGRYSDVVEPGRHFIPLRKDGANLDEVFAQLRDPVLVDDMTERAWREVIESGRFGYPAFIRMVDAEMETLAAARAPSLAGAAVGQPVTGRPTPLTASPVRWEPPSEALMSMEASVQKLRNVAVSAWGLTPGFLKPILRPLVRNGFMPVWRVLRSSVHKLLQGSRIQ